jgi:multidrug efflux pump subunit AcrA (membrane-fusion protein)
MEDYDKLWEEAIAGKVSEDSLAFQERLLRTKEQQRNLANVEGEYRIVDVILREYDLVPEQVIKNEKQAEKTKTKDGTRIKIGEGRHGIEMAEEDFLEQFGDLLNLAAASGKVRDDSGKSMNAEEILSKIRVPGSGTPAMTPAGGLIPQSSAYYPKALREEQPEVVSKYLKPLVDNIKNMEDRQKRLDQLAKYPEPLALYAPISGYVFHGSHDQQGWRVREREISAGATVRLTQPVCYVSNSVDMKITINVTEEDISKIKKGQATAVRPSPFPGLVLQGTVTEVSEVPVAGDEWESAMPGSAAGKYPVVINLTESDPRLRPKTNAGVEILCQEIKDAVFVPREAVFKKAGGDQGESKDKKVCYLWNGDKSVEREVKTGKRNDHFIIIKEGLKEGDEIFLYDPFLKK